MKISEILLEYRRDKTAQSLGDKIMDAIVRDPSLSFKDKTPEEIAELKERFKTDPVYQEYFLKKFEDGDPTNNKEYTQWIIRQYITSKIHRLEDVSSTVRDMLERYAYAKQRNKLQPEYRDINRLDVTALYKLVKDINLNEPVAQKTQQNAKEIYNDSEFRVIQPLDERAACYYGQGTQWCTAARNNNQFNYYNKNGPMYIVIPKHPQYEGEKYQIHFDSDQYTNEQDYDVGAVELIQRFPKLKSVLDFENNYTGSRFDLLSYDEWTPELAMKATGDQLDAHNIPDDFKTPEVVTSLIKNRTLDDVPEDVWTPTLALLAAKNGYIDAFPEKFAKLPEIDAVLHDKRVEVAKNKQYDRYTTYSQFWNSWLVGNAIKDGYINSIPEKFLRMPKIVAAIQKKIPDVDFKSKRLKYDGQTNDYVEGYQKLADKIWTPELALQAARAGKLSDIPDSLWTQRIAKIGADEWNYNITPKQFNSLPK